MREHVTTVFDAIALLAVNAGLGMALSQIAVPLGFIVGGLGLLGSSQLVEKFAGRKQ